MTNEKTNRGMSAKHRAMIAGAVILVAVGVGVFIARSSGGVSEVGPEGTWITTPPPPDNHTPEISITSPEDLTSHQASYDPESQTFRAVVDLAATASDADGDRFKVDWYSSLDGYLGSGERITTPLVTKFDSSQPIITARVTDEHGTTGEDTIQLIIWIPSDN